jgi:hypothetical protein
MATLQHRLSEFVSDGDPPEGTQLEVLCRDHNGTYLLPFTCQWHGHAWHSRSGHRIEAAVVGWRAPLVPPI